MKIKDYFTFFRVNNLLMIILIQLLLKYVLFKKFTLSTSLDDIHFFILILATVLIASGGYIINDINDIRSDIINKPNKVIVGKKISTKAADYLYLSLNFSGLVLGYYLSYSINNNSFFAIFIIASLLSYLYATKLKKKLFIKNLTVSILVFLGIFIVAIYDIVPATNTYNSKEQLLVFTIVLKISSFAFLLTLAREIIKDITDIQGDKKLKINTIPIALGQKKSKYIIMMISILLLISIIYFAISQFKTNSFSTFYLLIFVCLPLIYFLIQLKKSETSTNFKKLSKLLKLIMLSGILTVLFL